MIPRESKWAWARLAHLVIVCGVLACVACAFPAAAQQGSQRRQGHTLSGTVVDSGGAPIGGAEVEFSSTDQAGLQAAALRATTNAQGAFTIMDAAAGGTLEVRYPGFATANIEIAPGAPGDNLEVRLAPAPTVERIVVSGHGDDRIPAESTDQYLVPREELGVSGSLAVDDVLRQAPGFSLFRRSGSLFANPTTQGVSLRGVGANGASRATVLLDGIPLNDPFGGWVYWTQVPRVSIGSVEVFNGGASDVYGGGALGGVVNMHSLPVDGDFAHVEMSYGTENTPDVSFDAGAVLGKWGISADGQALRTSGYVLVPRDQRGSVDTRAGTADLAGTLQVSRKFGADGRFFVRGTAFGESRENGTPVQVNDTSMPSVAMGADWTQSRAGSFSVRVYGSEEVFHQNFSSIAANRNSETLTDRQKSPSQQVGFVGQWQRTFGAKNTVNAGMEVRDVQGHSAETTFSAAGPTADVDAGGRQRILGVFGQDTFHFARNWSLTFGGRVDSWLNSRGYMSRRPLPTGSATSVAFAPRTENAFSPRISLLRTFKHNILVSASVYQAFRPPTLNELYRNFRVGNVATNANFSLRAETLTGGEAGISVREWRERLTLRGNFFWSDIGDPVANVPISYSPASCVTNPAVCTLITQQRQNLGATRARGAEIDAELRLAKRLQVSAGYILTDSTVLSFLAQPALQGLEVPQIPKNAVTAQFSYIAEMWTAGVQARFIGNQFDDAPNLLPLGRAFTVDAELSRRLPVAHASIFAAAQNLFDDRYTVARTPITNIGPPVLARAGVRFDFH